MKANLICCSGLRHHFTLISKKDIFKTQMCKGWKYLEQPLKLLLT